MIYKACLKHSPLLDMIGVEKDRKKEDSAVLAFRQKWQGRK